MITALVAVLSTTGIALAMGQDHEPVPEPGGNVYLIVGQSNAAGRGDLPNELVPYPGVTVWNGNSFVPGTPNLNQFSTVARRTAEYNLGYTFGGSMSHATGQDIRLVVNARGGSSIANWLPNGAVEPDSGLQLFDEAVRQTRAALAVPGSELAGIVWHQGEANRDEAGWLGDLETVIDGFRSEFNDPNLPFVAGELSNERADNTAFNNRLRGITAINNADFVTAVGLATSDTTHFTTPAIREYGDRYAFKMLELLGNNPADIPEFIHEDELGGFNPTPIPNPTPGQPADGNCEASVNGSAVSLTWDQIPGEDSYVVRRNNSFVTTVNTTSFGESPGNGTFDYVIRYRQAGQVIDIDCNQVTVGGGGQPAPTPNPTPTPVGNLTCAVSVNASTATISWNSLAGIDTYQVRRDGSWIATSGGTSFNDSGLANGTYSYVIRYRTGGQTIDTTCSPSTVTIGGNDAPTPTPTPTPVGNLTCSVSVNGSTATISWNSLAGIDPYQVRRDGSWVATSGSTSFNDSGLANGTYSYVIRYRTGGQTIDTTCSPSTVTIGGNGAPAPTPTPDPTPVGGPFVPQPGVTYQLTAQNGSVFAGDSDGDRDAFALSTAAAAANPNAVAWEFVDAGNGQYHLDLAVGGNFNRLSVTDNASEPLFARLTRDRFTGGDKAFAIQETTPGSGTYFVTALTNPTAGGNDRLFLTNNDAGFTQPNTTGANVTFTITLIG